MSFGLTARAGGASALAAVLLGAGGLAVADALLEVRPLPAVPARELEIEASAVATLEGVVRHRRSGRVVRTLVSPGEAVRAGGPILEFEDLGLQASKAELDKEIAELRRDAVKAAAERRNAAGAAPRELRLAALEHLEESYEAARRDFERWNRLHEEGLVARLDYERKARELAELEAQVRAARASADREQAQDREPPEDPAPADLRRAQRLRKRLDRLSRTFVARSPWDGTLRRFHVVPGDVPDRGRPIATVERAARPQLVADVSDAGTVVAVRSACGVPGPFPYTIREGSLRMTVPALGTRPGEMCRIVVRARR